MKRKVTSKAIMIAVLLSLSFSMTFAQHPFRHHRGWMDSLRFHGWYHDSIPAWLDSVEAWRDHHDSLPPFHHDSLPLPHDSGDWHPHHDSIPPPPPGDSGDWHHHDSIPPPPPGDSGDWHHHDSIPPPPPGDSGDWHHHDSIPPPPPGDSGDWHHHDSIPPPPPGDSLPPPPPGDSGHDWHDSIPPPPPGDSGDWHHHDSIPPPPPCDSDSLGMGGHHHKLANPNADLNINATVYPNPAVERATIHIENASNVLILRLYDSNGRLSTEQSVGNGDYNLERNTFKAGVYIYQVINPSDGSLIKTGKIIFQ